MMVLWLLSLLWLPREQFRLELVVKARAMVRSIGALAGLSPPSPPVIPMEYRGTQNGSVSPDPGWTCCWKRQQDMMRQCGGGGGGRCLWHNPAVFVWGVSLVVSSSVETGRQAGRQSCLVGSLVLARLAGCAVVVAWWW